MRNAGGNLKICKSDQTYSQVGYRTLVEVFRLLQIVRLPPEFRSRPPSGATLPPGEGIAAFGVPATPGGVALQGYLWLPWRGSAHRFPRGEAVRESALRNRFSD